MLFLSNSESGERYYYLHNFNWNVALFSILTLCEFQAAVFDVDDHLLPFSFLTSVAKVIVSVPCLFLILSMTSSICLLLSFAELFSPLSKSDSWLKQPSSWNPERLIPINLTGWDLKLPQFNGHFKNYTDGHTMKKKGMSVKLGYVQGVRPFHPCLSQTLNKTE